MATIANWEKIAGFIFGVIFVAAILGLSVFIPDPTPTQYATFKTILALAAAGVGGILAGTIQVKGSIQKWSVRAGGAMALFVIVYFFAPAPVNTTNNIGISFEQYTAVLDKRETEIRQLLVDQALGERDKEELNQQLARVDQLRQNEQASYEAHVKDLQERINRLDQLSGQVPDKFIEGARQALANGDNAKADQLFTQVEEQADPHIAAAAEAAYQRGKLSQDAIKYHQAMQHYQRAIQLSPDDPLYLMVAGIMAGILARHQQQIEWNEQALAIYLEQEGADSPEAATLRNNLGEAWRSKGEYDKAIEYYELALASDLKTFGEDHPNVARDRNNLGLAWDSLGEYDRAIEYYELALATFEKMLGVDHPSTKTVAGNLASARAEQ
jgi:tetratricopeptide (TPR) repeat protein